MCDICQGIQYVISDGSNYPWRYTSDMPSDKARIVLRNDLSAGMIPCPKCNFSTKIEGCPEIMI